MRKPKVYRKNSKGMFTVYTSRKEIYAIPEERLAKIASMLHENMPPREASPLFPLDKSDVAFLKKTFPRGV